MRPLLVFAIVVDSWMILIGFGGIGFLLWLIR